MNENENGKDGENTTETGFSDGQIIEIWPGVRYRKIGSAIVRLWEP